MHNDIIISHLVYCVIRLLELQWRHLVILACSKTFVEKRSAENRMQNRMWNSCLDFIVKEI